MAATEPIIDLHVPGHGYYRCTPDELDIQIVRHLPTSINALRIELGERTGLDYSDVATLSELLIVCADIEPSRVAQ